MSYSIIDICNVIQLLVIFINSELYRLLTEDKDNKKKTNIHVHYWSEIVLVTTIQH